MHRTCQVISTMKGACRTGIAYRPIQLSRALVAGIVPAWGCHTSKKMIFSSICLMRDGSFSPIGTLEALRVQIFHAKPSIAVNPQADVMLRFYLHKRMDHR